MTWSCEDALEGLPGAGWGALWSVLFTTERAVTALTAVTSLAESLDLISLGERLRDACDDVAAHHPLEVLDAVAVDLGPITGTGTRDIELARGVIAHLLDASIAHADAMAIDSKAPARLWLSALAASLLVAQRQFSAAGAR